MGDASTGALRAVRSLALALVVVGLASTAHLVGGGDLPPGLLLAGVVVVVTAAAHAVTARRLGLPAALALLGAGQVVLHAAFAVLAAPPGTDAAAARLSGPLHVHAHGGPHSGLLLPADLPVDAGAVVVPDDPATWSAGLLALVLHAVATLAAAVVVAGSDRSLWLLLAWLAPLVAVVAAAALVVAPRPLRPAPVAHHRRPRALLLARRSPRRGPPRALPAPA